MPFNDYRAVNGMGVKQNDAERKLCSRSISNRPDINTRNAHPH
jgi:hypothetical protein